MKRLLIVVDYQNDFVCGSLGFDKAKELEKGILEKIAEYQNDEIIYTLDTHFDGYLTTAIYVLKKIHSHRLKWQSILKAKTSIQ